ncbi:MAG: motility protein A [Clostridia bacterium]|nr:motility protein A [Clostridia bacterium]
MKSTLIGLVLGTVFVVWSIVISGDVKKYFDPASVMIVVGGTIAAELVTYSFEQIKGFLPKLKDAFRKPDIDLMADMEKILSLANVARREGLLALDGEDFGDPFLQKGVEMIVDGTDPELFKDVMETLIGKAEEEDEVSQKILTSGAQYAPAFGMVGTLIGLINMLMYLEDSASLGPNMGVALITTFYGVILANLFFLPFAAKLKTAASLRILRYELMLEGMLSLQNGENPRIIREKLIAFIPEAMRSVAAETGKEGAGEAIHAEEKAE